MKVKHLEFLIFSVFSVSVWKKKTLFSDAFIKKTTTKKTPKASNLAVVGLISAKLTNLII